MPPNGNSCFWSADISNLFYSESTLSNETKLYTKHIWKVLYNAPSFRLDGTKNIAATAGNSCFWLAESSKLLPSETTCPNVTMLEFNKHFLILSRLKSYKRYRLTLASCLFVFLFFFNFVSELWCILLFFQQTKGTSLADDSLEQENEAAKVLIIIVYSNYCIFIVYLAGHGFYIWFLHNLYFCFVFGHVRLCQG